MTKYLAGQLGIIRFLPASFQQSEAFLGLCITYPGFGRIATNGCGRVLAFLLISYRKIT